MKSTTRVHLCGTDYTPGPRDECPNALHDWPLPGGYVEASREAQSRLNRLWGTSRCRDCHLYGWTPGRLNEGEKPTRLTPGVNT